MPKRPRFHIIEDLSRDELRRIFNQYGWVVWDLHPDYGEDQFVRIFATEEATPYSFFIQAKSTDHIDDIIDKDREVITFSIKTEHIKHWNKFWEPVILTVWDARSDVTYWLSIQDYLASRNIKDLRKKSLSVEIPIDNILNEEGIKRIAVRTKNRFERFEQERSGSEVLVELLEEALGTKIEYGSEGLIMMHNPDGGVHVRLFSELAQRASSLASQLGVSVQEALETSFEVIARFLDAVGDLDRNKIEITNSQGNIKQSFKSFRHLERHIEKQDELRAYEKLKLDEGT